MTRVKHAALPRVRRTTTLVGNDQKAHKKWCRDFGSPEKTVLMNAQMTSRSVHLHVLCIVGMMEGSLSFAHAPPSMETVASTAANLFRICKALQDPDMYSPEWADACTFRNFKNERGGELVASRDVRQGEVLSLYPLHAIGLYGDTEQDETMMLFDVDLDGEHFRDSKDLTHRHDIELLDEMTHAYPPFCQRRNVLFVDVNPTRPFLPGWLGHLAKETSSETHVASNCILVPLAGTAPLCALVSTSDITQGQELFRSSRESATSINEYAQSTAERYYNENSELRSYLNLACADDSQENVDVNMDHDKNSLFHNVQRQYPGLEVLHTSPDVLVVQNFLTNDECNRIMAKAKPHLVPCLVKNAESGKVEVDPDRTSFNINIPKDEVPTIVSKVTALANCDERQLEILQVLRYTEGQYFTPHTDGFSGPISAAGFQHSGRLVTIFVYLNDVQQGGQTRFTEFGLDVVPCKGMAVLHFPTSLDLKQDYRTKHEGIAAVDEKWLLVTWVWKNFRTDQRYGELNDLPLDQNDII